MSKLTDVLHKILNLTGDDRVEDHPIHAEIDALDTVKENEPDEPDEPVKAEPEATEKETPSAVE